MPYTPSILIADDEESFRKSTTRLLQQEGFKCHSAEDAEQAIEYLQESQFDLLITDIRMPHNDDMRLVRKVRDLAQAIAVIVVTGYPSTETAIASIELPVTYYMIKPFDFDELLRHIRTSLKASLRRRAITAVCEQLRSCATDLETIRLQPLHCNTRTADEIPNATIHTLAASLSELLNLLPGATSRNRHLQSLCQVLDCPNKPVCREAILETIEVLKETKDTFKSKSLAVLRGKLEHVIGRL